MHVHPAVYARGIPLLLAAAAFVYFKVTMHGPNATIVVVDRRTMRLARKRIDEALTAGDLVRASNGQMSLIVWLRHESVAGPRRYRQGYATLLRDIREDHAALVSQLLTNGQA